MRVRLFGGLKATAVDGVRVQFATRKSSLLFAFLVLSGLRGLRREQVADLLWAGRGDAQARNSLRQALADIRKWFPGDADADIHVAGDHEAISLVAPSDAVDVHLFDRKLDGGISDLVEAAELYGGDVLSGHAIPDGAEDWLRLYRQRYHDKAQHLVERLSIAFADTDEIVGKACEALAERLQAANPASEAAHRAIMRVHAGRGHENLALRQLEICKVLLKRHLDVEPEAQTIALAESLLSSARPVPRHAAVLLQQEEKKTRSNSSSARRFDQPSIAVMPFDNLGAPEDDYFADGVVEEITSALSRVRDFFVIARQSAFTYKGRFVDVREVGKELGVNYVVEGTVRRGGDRLRISVQLVDAETRTQLWSERYEGAMEDIFQFQDRIAAQVAGAIHPAIRSAEIELAKGKAPASLRAYDLVMRAYPHLWGRRREANQEAIDLLRRATTIDPTYSRAHALLAWCHASNAAYLWTEQPESELIAAFAAIDAAGSIGDDPTALTAAGAAISICGDQERANAYIEKALSLDPNNAWAWARHGWIAIYQDRELQATERFQRAIILSPRDPLSFNMKLGMATSLAKTGSYSEAITIAREVIARYPDAIVAYRYLAAWTSMNDDLETARWAASKLLAAQPDFTIQQYLALPFFRHMKRWADQVAEALKRIGLPER